MLPLSDTSGLSQLEYLLPQGSMLQVYNKLQKANAVRDELILICSMAECRISTHPHKMISGMPRGSIVPKELLHPPSTVTEMPDTSPLLLVWVPGPEAPNVVLTSALDTVPTILPKLFNTQNNPMKVDTVVHTCVRKYTGRFNNLRCFETKVAPKLSTMLPYYLSTVGRNTVTNLLSCPLRSELDI